MVEIGQKAPSFELVDTDLKPRKLRDFLGKKIVLAFYPGAFTSVCTKEMCTFRDSLFAYNALDAQVIGISVNDPFSNKAFAEKNDLSFPLLSDYRRRVVRRYGVALDNFAGMKGYTAAQRSVFILDKKGVVRFKWISDNPGREPNYKMLEQALKEIS